MTRQRITQLMVDQQMVTLARLNGEIGLPVPTLWQGNHEAGIHNRLTVGRNGHNVWPDGMAGTTRRDCYNALRIMVAQAAIILEHQEDMRLARARTGL